MKKKKWLSSILILGAVVSLAACGNSEANVSKSSSGSDSKSSKTTTMNLSTFALNQDIVESTVISPFEKDKNVDVTLDVGTAEERLTKLESGTTEVDAIELSQINASEGKTKDLFTKISKSEVPNISNLSDGAKAIWKKGLGVPYAVNSIGIIYDEKAVGFKINSWDDLWKASLKGKISIPDISTTFGPAMLYVASDHAGKDITSDKGKAAFNALEELSPNVVKTYSKSSDLANMFSSGEISVAVIADYAYSTVDAAKSGLTYKVPSTTYANYNTINVPSSAKNKNKLIST